MGDKATEFRQDILADRKKSRKTKATIGPARSLEASMHKDRLKFAKQWNFGALSVDKKVAPSSNKERTRQKTGTFDFSNEELDSSDDDSRAEKSKALGQEEDNEEIEEDMQEQQQV